MNRVVGIKVISNYGVGVDHINVSDAATRGIPVVNTPKILDGVIADMAFTFLLAVGWSRALVTYVSFVLLRTYRAIFSVEKCME